MKDSHSRRRPFAAWIKRVANLKSSSHNQPQASKTKRNNPYPESGHLHRSATAESTNGHLSRRHSCLSNASYASPDRSQPAKSAAPTLATNPETIHSKAETSNTRGGALSSRDGGDNSTFSSPNHSDHSLATTLTTIRSTAPSALLNGGTFAPPAALHAPSVHFSHQYPVTPASAVPAHLHPQPGPHTYHAATAGNTLFDNASILTLASSSKRRRRNSLDTNASVRALAPSSVWGGSRESLPLSVLSANADAVTSPGYPTSNRPGLSSIASVERASVYSSSGAPPRPSSDRNSYYGPSKQGAETASVRSGPYGHHGRAESLAGSVYAGATAGPAHRASSGSSRMINNRDSYRQAEDEHNDELQVFGDHYSDQGRHDASIDVENARTLRENGVSVN